MQGSLDVEFQTVLELHLAGRARLSLDVVDDDAMVAPSLAPVLAMARLPNTGAAVLSAATIVAPITTIAAVFACRKVLIFLQFNFSKILDIIKLQLLFSNFSESSEEHTCQQDCARHSYRHELSVCLE